MEKVKVMCSLCGKTLLKPKSRIRENNFCCAAHCQQWNAIRLTEYNRTANPLNKPGGAVSSRKKHREKFSGTGEGKAYRKFMAGTSTGRLRRPCWAGPCGAARWYITGTATS